MKKLPRWALRRAADPPVVPDVRQERLARIRLYPATGRVERVPKR